LLAVPPFSLLHTGGERVLEVFDVKLKEAIYKLPFDKILTLKNVSAGQGVVYSAQRRLAPPHIAPRPACTHI
jgi:hypothetical protein